jgi:hypothetical protein
MLIPFGTAQTSKLDRLTMMCLQRLVSFIIDYYGIYKYSIHEKHTVTPQ